jgi:hypothetical protein
MDDTTKQGRVLQDASEPWWLEAGRDAGRRSSAARRPALVTYTYRRGVRYKDGKKLRVETQKGAEGQHWNVAGKGYLLRLEYESFAPGSTVPRERSVEWLRIGQPSQPAQTIKAKGRGRPTKFGRPMTAAERMRLKRHGTAPVIDQKEQTL